MNLSPAWENLIKNSEEQKQRIVGNYINPKASNVNESNNSSSSNIVEETCEMISNIGGALDEHEKELLKAIFENDGKEDTDDSAFKEITEPLGKDTNFFNSHIMDDNLRRILGEDDDDID